jgi:hypothetical protein
MYCKDCKFFKNHIISTVTYKSKLKEQYEYGTCINKIFTNSRNQKGIMNIDYGSHSWDDKLQVGIDFGCVHFKEKKQ